MWLRKNKKSNKQIINTVIDKNEEVLYYLNQYCDKDTDLENLFPDNYKAIRFFINLQVDIYLPSKKTLFERPSRRSLLVCRAIKSELSGLENNESLKPKERETIICLRAACENYISVFSE
jgi:hypothetical protein